MLLTLLILALLIFGGNVGYWALFGAAHPLAFLAQALVLLLLFFIGKRLVDEYL